MHKLHKILKQIYKELEAAEDYIHCAANSENDPRDVYKSLARDELSHADKLVNLCNRHIEDEMKAIWEFEKESIMERIIHNKTKLQHVD